MNQLSRSWFSRVPTLRPSTKTLVSITNKPPPVSAPQRNHGATYRDAVLDASGTSALHVWSLGDVTVEVRSSKPLSPKHFKLLAKYVALAGEAAELPGSDDPT